MCGERITKSCERVFVEGGEDINSNSTGLKTLKETNESKPGVDVSEKKNPHERNNGEVSDSDLRWSPGNFEKRLNNGKKEMKMQIRTQNTRLSFQRRDFLTQHTHGEEEGVATSGLRRRALGTFERLDAVRRVGD